MKEAFGSRWGFVAIWLQWIQNVVWYPTVLAFSAAAIAYVVGRPALANNGAYVGLFCIVAYWLATLITLRGVDAIAKVTSWAFLAGTVLPGVIIIVLAVDLDRPGQPDRDAASDRGTTPPSVMSMAGGHAHPRLLPVHHRHGRHRLPRRHHPAVRRRRGARGARQRDVRPEAAISGRRC